MECSCHISPPCSYCSETYECVVCGKVKHPEDGEPEWNGDEPTCPDCKEESYEISDDQRE